MNRARSVAFLVCLLTLVSGCKTFYGPAKHDYSFKEGNKDGLVIASFPATESYSAWGFREADTKKYRGSAEVRKKFGWDSPFAREIRYEEAVVVALKIPEGDYEFYCWGDGYSYSATPFSVGFKSIAGKAVYIGNLAIEWRGNHSARVVVTDKWKNDIPAFKKHYQNIRDDQIAYHYGGGKQ